MWPCPGWLPCPWPRVRVAIISRHAAFVAVLRECAAALDLLELVDAVAAAVVVQVGDAVFADLAPDAALVAAFWVEPVIVASVDDPGASDDAQHRAGCPEQANGS